MCMCVPKRHPVRNQRSFVIVQMYSTPVVHLDKRRKKKGIHDVAPRATEYLVHAGPLSKIRFRAAAASFRIIGV
jgi:hypothetical protein